MLRADNIHYQVGGRALVSDANLFLTPGEVMAVLGPNGAGKSTLLKMLSGQLRPTSGAVFLEGKNLAQWLPRELACRRSVLPQQASVPFDFTAREIVFLGRAPHGDAPAEMIREAMEWTECAHLADRIVTTLSGGELQRVHLARVLVQISLGQATRSCLLLDEPVAGLDLAHQHAVLQIARRIAGQGSAVLAILHDLNLAAQYCDRILLLKDGRIAASGPPEETFVPPLIKEIFSMHAEILRNPFGKGPAVLCNPLP